MKQWLAKLPVNRMIWGYLHRHKNLLFLLKYTILFTVLLLSLASMSLNRILSSQSNPFFYGNF
jgi:hypothetical protein